MTYLVVGGLTLISVLVLVLFVVRGWPRDRRESIGDVPADPVPVGPAAESEPARPVPPPAAERRPTGEIQAVGPAGPAGPQTPARPRQDAPSPPGPRGQRPPAQPAADPPGEQSPPGSARRPVAEPLVRGRVGERDEGWRPPSGSEPSAGRDDPVGRFDARGRVVPKYVPPIDELRARAEPSPEGGPSEGPPAPGTAPAEGRGARPSEPGKSRPPAPGPPDRSRSLFSVARPEAAAAPTSPERTSPQPVAHPGSAHRDGDRRPPAAGPAPATSTARGEQEPLIDLTDRQPVPPPDPPPAPPAPVVKAEPADEHVDQILHALVRRARDRQLAIADVAVELVEQAELEDRDIDDVLADLVEHTGDVIEPDREERRARDVSPHRSGRLVNLEEMEPAEKKRIIVRVLCLLVAFQDANGADRSPRPEGGAEWTSSSRLP